MSFGIWKLLLLLAIILVIFGPGKLPNALRDLGKGFKSFKDELKDDEAKDKSEDPKTIIINPKKK